MSGTKDMHTKSVGNTACISQACFVDAGGMAASRYNIAAWGATNHTFRAASMMLQTTATCTFMHVSFSPDLVGAGVAAASICIAAAEEATNKPSEWQARCQ